MFYQNKFRVYKTKPSRASNFQLMDVARNKYQAYMLGKSFPKDMIVYVVKTGKSRGKNRDVFPYTLYVYDPFDLSFNKRNIRR